MIYKNYNLLKLFSIRAWMRRPTISSPVCIRSVKKVGQPGFKKAPPRYRKNVVTPRNPVTVIPKKYKILKAAGNVTIKNTNKWDKPREMLELSSSYECTEYDLLFLPLFATEVHRNDIYLGAYKFFAGQGPLEFTTLGFTEMKNEMEVL